MKILSLLHTAEKKDCCPNTYESNLFRLLRLMRTVSLLRSQTRFGKS